MKICFQKAFYNFTGQLVNRTDYNVASRIDTIITQSHFLWQQKQFMYTLSKAFVYFFTFICGLQVQMELYSLTSQSNNYAIVPI